MIRPFKLGDLDAAVRFCAAARELDPSIEPFGERLGSLARGPRAALDLWRVGEDAAGALQGIAFAALREEGALDVYAAVHPRARRRGVARALAQPALAANVVLRARVREQAVPGRAFLRDLGFSERGAQLALQWSGLIREPRATHGVSFRRAAECDGAEVRRLSDDAWAGAPATFTSRPGEIEQLVVDPGHLVLVAEGQGRGVGYLIGAVIEGALAIEEIAVLPAHRRGGIGRALLASALAKTPAAVLTVDESNLAARALYRSFGFTEASRRLVFERRP